MTILFIGIWMMLLNPFLVASFVIPNKLHAPRHRANGSRLSMQRLDVVLYGVGDLRTKDHAGLTAAVEAENNKILPVVVLDPDTMRNIPDGKSHTVDTATVLSAALDDLQSQLLSLGLDLSISMGEDTVQVLERASKLGDEVHVHVCDLGSADNALGYGPFAKVQSASLPSNVKLRSWTCNLREAAWKDLESLSVEYPDNGKLFSKTPKRPLNQPAVIEDDSRILPCLDGCRDKAPTAQEVTSLLQSTLGLDPTTCIAEKDSGLLDTHWGGLVPSSIGEGVVQLNLETFVDECGEDDEKWAANPNYVGRQCVRNGKSLEHAAICWMMKGDGKTPTTTTGNLIAGESITRYLLAPLLFGTISARQVWHASKKGDSPLFPSPLRTLANTREWHKLLAARNMKTNPAYSENDDDKFHYKYFRWQGSLCRYAKAPGRKQTKEGVLLVHGFGASSSQMFKTFQELGTNIDMGLAPDLIGFGQSEKPPITYTQYLWEGYVGDFIKEIAIGKEKWDSFILGGNSIGGYTSMATAADDTITAADSLVSSRGAPGTGKCSGLVLMNSAGRLQNKDEIAKMKEAGNNMVTTMADITSIDGLPNCSPFPRPVARVFGNALLGYLRPRIFEICVNLYPINDFQVKEELVNNIYRDSVDPGAINVMISGSKLPPPRTANELLGATFGSAESEGGTIKEGMYKGPVLIAQGYLDPLNNARERAETFASLRSGITIKPINGGHCPHDEQPRDVAKAMVDWMEERNTVPTASEVKLEA